MIDRLKKSIRTKESNEECKICTIFFLSFPLLLSLVEDHMILSLRSL